MAHEASELIEAMENAINALEDSQDYESEMLIDRWRERFWESTGEGGAAIEGLKAMVKRLRERGN